MTAINLNPNVQCDARIVKTELGPVSLIPRKYSSDEFELRFKGRMWIANIRRFDGGVWGCTSYDDVPSGLDLQSLVEDLLEGYLKNATIACPNIRERLLAL